MTYDLHRGESPLLVSIPHMGTDIPAEFRPAFRERALAVEDADWHMDRLYAFAAGELGATVLKPRHARYVVDLNRPPDDTPMYPGASNTELCPTRFFSGEPLYLEGRQPDAAAREARRERFWKPYHQALASEIARIRERHGFVLLWDAHSIRSEIPWLFEGVLPDLNIGTAGGASADDRIAQAVVRAAARPGVSHVLNGRFQGGYITRHYGRPAEHVHAVQLEMCQKLYMREAPPYDWIAERAERIRPVVRDMVAAALAAGRRLHGV